MVDSGFLHNLSSSKSVESEDDVQSLLVRSIVKQNVKGYPGGKRHVEGQIRLHDDHWTWMHLTFYPS